MRANHSISMAMKSFEHIPSKEDGLAAFREEIAALEDEETRRKETAHFDGVQVEELTEEDRALWERFKADVVTREELSRYQREVFQRGVSKSRQAFCEYIANKLMIRFGEEELRKLDE